MLFITINVSIFVLINNTTNLKQKNTMRKIRRIVKIENKVYKDIVSGLYIYQLHDAASLGITVWIISKTKDGEAIDSNQEIEGCKFQDCKNYLYKTYPDN